MGRRLLVPDLLNRYPYAFWFKPSRGTHDPIMARALVLQSGPRRVLWIAVDLIGPDPEMVSELRERLAAIGLRYDAVILAASHTHSGPGGFSRSRLFGFLALDSFVPAVRERSLRGMTEAARGADRAQGPAREADPAALGRRHGSRLAGTGAGPGRPGALHERRGRRREPGAAWLARRAPDRRRARTGGPGDVAANPRGGRIGAPRGVGSPASPRRA